MLVERGADINQVDGYECTPCWYASQKGHLEIVRLLVELGADINQANNNSCTPCYMACWKGHLDVVRLLVERGANPMIKDKVSRVCLYWL